MDVFFLAAGLGTRFKPITDSWPKPCIPFLNVPMGLYHFRFLTGIDFNDLVVNTHHHPDKVMQLYNTQPYCFKKIRFSNEETILDTAGGLKKAFQYKKDQSPILMMNADEIIFPVYNNFLKAAIDFHDQEKPLATLVVMQHPEAGKKFGAIWCDNQQVKNIGKTNSDPTLKPWHYIGIMLLDAKILNLIENEKSQNIFYDILIHHLDTENVKIYPITADWYETGNAKDFLLATQDMIPKLKTDKKLKEFIDQYDESKIIENSLISKKIDNKNLKLLGYNVVSKTAQTKETSIMNSVLFEDQKITDQ